MVIDQLALICVNLRRSGRWYGSVASTTGIRRRTRKTPVHPAGYFLGGKYKMQSTVSFRFQSTFVFALAAVLMLGVSTSAHAALERAGPVSNDPRIGGFPAWYQDTTGVAVEFCDPLTQAEVDGGWCLLLATDVTFPESFPTNFFDEHFYFAGDASLTPQVGKALVRVAVEAAFVKGPVVAGDQMAFARIRVKL